MKIAIEGMDGVGKTTVSKAVAEKLNISYLDKPLHFFFEGANGDSYVKLGEMLNNLYKMDDPVIKAWLIGLGNLFSFRNFKDEDIIIDRHFASNYFWNGTEESKVVFKTMIDLIGVPDLTILLYASPETRMKRLYDRDPDDVDLTDPEKHVLGYDKMLEFLDEFEIPYTLVNTEERNVDEVIEEVCQIVEQNMLVNEVACSSIEEIQ